jgi:hypothetical protein
MSAWEDYLRQNAGLPIQQSVGQAGQLTDDQILAMKQQAMQAMAASPSQAPNAPPIPPTPPVPNVQPNSPSMTPQDAQSRMNAMIAAPLSGGAALDFDTAAKMRAANLAAQAPSQQATPSEDMSGYTDVPKPQAPGHQFPRIQAKVQKNKAAAQPDIRSTLHGAQEMTPEMWKKLGYGDPEEDNNKAGSEEGSYGP